MITFLVYVTLPVGWIAFLLSSETYRQVVVYTPPVKLLQESHRRLLLVPGSDWSAPISESRCPAGDAHVVTG